MDEQLVVDGGYSHAAHVAVCENHGDYCGSTALSHDDRNAADTYQM
jgi:hypothetical protein